MAAPSPDRTASLMTPAKLAQAGRVKAAASPAAWLDQMAADAGHTHLRRLEQLCDGFGERLSVIDHGAVSASYQAMRATLGEIDYSLLGDAHGLWSRVTGRSKRAHTDFADQYERADDALSTLAVEVGESDKRFTADILAGERAVVEIKMESQAVESIIDQGARWLQDMRNQLKTRQAAAQDAQSRRLIDEDTARCDILVARLKTLRAVCTAAKEARKSIRLAGVNRTAMIEKSGRPLAEAVRVWRGDAAELLRAAEVDKATAGMVERCLALQHELEKQLKQAATAHRQLASQRDEHLAALAAVGRPPALVS